ncbi:hypothetical protein [uncultured Microbulbifer sp.]|uniref:hypothetical protein n=1 Tax=uncultured Microbulbifer sp. TaxID=348147 RepID=UPI0026017628|nr:hypothetical protein [uncultured Microbulbifer sp.]
MKVRLLYISLLGLFLTVNAAANDNSIYVSGIRHTLDHNSFIKVGRKYIATIRVVGDIGQPLIFDIDSKIKGFGFYDIGFECYQIIDRKPDGTYRTVPGNPPNCQLTRVNPSNEFYFSARLNVSCSGIVIGTSTENKNALLSTQQLQAIKGSVDLESGQVIGNPYDRNRNINLLVDAAHSTGGQCKELRLEIEGLHGTQIYEIVSNVTIAEPF